MQVQSSAASLNNIGCVWRSPFASPPATPSTPLFPRYFDLSPWSWRDRPIPDRFVICHGVTGRSPPPSARNDPLHNHRRALALDTCHRKTVLPATRRVRCDVPRVKRDVIFRGVSRDAKIGTCAREESTPGNVERARTLGSHHVALPRSRRDPGVDRTATFLNVTYLNRDLDSREIVNCAFSAGCGSIEQKRAKANAVARVA